MTGRKRRFIEVEDSPLHNYSLQQTIQQTADYNASLARSRAARALHPVVRTHVAKDAQFYTVDPFSALPDRETLPDEEDPFYSFDYRRKRRGPFIHPASLRGVEGTALAGVVAVVVGDGFVDFSRLDIIRLILRNSGVVQPELQFNGLKATHVIFGGNYAHPAVEEALNSDVHVVSGDWVLECVAAGETAFEGRFAVSPRPLTGLCFLAVDAGFSMSIGALASAIQTFGGALVDVASAEVTHVLAGESVTHELLQAAYEADIPVVTEAYVHACVRSGRQVNAAAYCLPESVFLTDSQGGEKGPLLHVDLRSAVRAPDGSGYLCIVSACGKKISGTKAALREHLEDHYRGREWAPQASQTGLPAAAPRPSPAPARPAPAPTAPVVAAVAASPASSLVVVPKRPRGRPRRSSTTPARKSDSKKHAGVSAVAVLTEKRRCVAADCTEPAPPVDAVTCSSCGKEYHFECASLTREIVKNLATRTDWKCSECKACEVCGDSKQDDKMLCCDSCDRGFHCFCLTPPLDAIPEGHWLCRYCEPSAASPTKPRTSVSDEALQVLKEWLFANTKKETLSNEEREELAKRTGLTATQVETWFINARKRILGAQR